MRGDRDEEFTAFVAAGTASSTSHSVPLERGLASGRRRCPVGTYQALPELGQGQSTKIDGGFRPDHHCPRDDR